MMLHDYLLFFNLGHYSKYGLYGEFTVTLIDDKTLYINSQLGDDFRCLLSCETGFRTVGL